jgi:hypothetical protein
MAAAIASGAKQSTFQPVEWMNRRPAPVRGDAPWLWRPRIHANQEIRVNFGARLIAQSGVARYPKSWFKQKPIRRSPLSTRA